MQSNWLDATLHISPEELRLFNWVEGVMEDEELDLTNDEECDIMAIRECEKEL